MYSAAVHTEWIVLVLEPGPKRFLRVRVDRGGYMIGFCAGNLALQSLLARGCGASLVLYLPSKELR